MKAQDIICIFTLALLFIATPALAQDDVSMMEEIAELITDVKALNGTMPPTHDGHDHSHHDHAMDKNPKAEAGDGSQHESPTFTDADRTATIAGSLLMVFIVAAGLLIAYVLNVYKKKLDDQEQLEV